MKQKCKKLLSVVLSIVILMTSILCVDLSVFAESNTTLDSLETYKAQCFLGIAYDEKSNAVENCNNIYNYYVNDSVYSPSTSFLDSCYNDEKLMMSYNEWKLYSLAQSPSSALDKVVKKEDYYESLIISMYSRATAENDKFKKFINNKVVKSTNKFIGTLCDIAKVSNISQLADSLDVNSQAGIELIEKGVSKYYAPSIVGKFTGKLGKIISASNTIYDLSQRISLYGTMAELDESTKLWINQMYQSCSDDGTDPALSTALLNLSMASTDFAGVVFADVCSTSFQLTKWGVKTTIDEGIKLLIGANPVVKAVFVGLSAGKTICNIFFNTDDVCEQLYLMECIYEVEYLSRKVINESKNTFINIQSLSNAQSFLYAVDCYFEAIIDLDIDCMEKFLDKLYNGGIIKGNQNDYNEHISVLEDLRNIREDNYNQMISYYETALHLNFPDEYEDYFGNTVMLQNIDFSFHYILPEGYPEGYADILVGESNYVSVSYYPSNTTQIGYTLKSSNSDILKIDGDKAVGVSAGTAILTVTSAVNPNVFYSKEIKVGEKLLIIDEIEANSKFKYVIENGCVTITGLADSYRPEKLTIPTHIGTYPVTSIGERAFCAYSFLTSVTIGNNVKRIGDGAFVNCTRLTSITVDSKNPNYSSEDGVLFNKDKTKLIQCPIGNTRTSYNIPNSVTSIEDYAFWFCASLTSVTIGNNVKSIGSYAFDGCGRLTSVTIPTSVTSIGDYAFWFCASLTSVTIGNNVKSIGSYAFEGCGRLTSVTIPTSVTSIGDEAFGDCESLKSITVSDDNHNYSSKDGVLFNKDKTKLIQCPIGNTRTSYSIPNGVTSIGDFAFKNCTRLTSVTIPNSVTIVGYSAFYNTAYYNDGSNWDNDVLYIDNYLINTKPNVVNTSIKDGTKVIARGVFSERRSLTSVTIPNSVTSIGEAAFWNCHSLTSVTISNSLTSIGDFVFCACISLKNITIPDSVTSIGEAAFGSCISLTSVTIGNNVKSIGDSAFVHCTRLTSITVDSKNPNYSSEDGVLFNKDKTKLIQCPIGNTRTSYNIPNSVTSIEDYAFWFCASLTSVTIGNNVKSIGSYAFVDCSSLTDVYYTGSKEEWNDISIGKDNSELINATIHYNYVPTCNHNIVTDEAVAPTCTETGLTEGKHCSKCGEIIVEQKVVSKLTHTYKTYTTKATASSDGKIVKKCNVCGKIASTTVIPKASSISISKTKYTYDGNYKKPTVTVKDSKGNKISTANYSVAYSNNKYVGKASVKITFKGNYSGSKTLYFTINPKGTTISSLSGTSKGFKATWKKQATQTTGYQIQYSTSSKFTNPKTVTVTKNSTTSKSISKLTAKKKYYVRVRTYKTVNGTKYYSAWSSSKSVTTKK